MITKIIHEDKIQKAHKYIEKGESFVIVTHVSPDGDAIGSETWVTITKLSPFSIYL